MALPVTQTADLIKTEALKLAGYPSPTSAQLSRAENWLRHALNQIYKQKDLKIMEESKITTLPKYTRRIAVPSDFDKILGLRLFHGEHIGLSQAGSANTLTLEAGEDITEDEILGKLLFLTYSNLVSRVVAYDEATLIATVSPSWLTLPSIDGYMIGETEKKLEPSPRELIDDNVLTDVPTYYFEYRMPKEIYFDTVVDTDYKYCLIMRYVVDPHYIDLTDSRMTSVYNELQEELNQYIFSKQLLDDNDKRANDEWKKALLMIENYKQKDSRQRSVRDNLKVRSIGGMPG